MRFRHPPPTSTHPLTTQPHAPPLTQHLIFILIMRITFHYSLILTHLLIITHTHPTHLSHTPLPHNPFDSLFIFSLSLYPPPFLLPKSISFIKKKKIHFSFLLPQIAPRKLGDTKYLEWNK